MIKIDNLIDEAIEVAEKFFNSNKLSDAAVVLKQTLKVDEFNLRALQLFGIVNHRDKNYKEAISFLKKALILNPKNAENHNNISLSYSCNFDFEKARHHMEKAISLDPDNANYHSNYGLLIRQMGDLDKAKEEFELAIKLDPEIHYPWINLGSLLGIMKNFHGAKEAYDTALSKCKNKVEASTIHVNISYAYFLQNNWNEGWKEYEYRWQYLKQLDYYKRLYGDKKWQKGTDITGKKLVVFCEQGDGDMIQFIRFLPLLRKQKCKVLLHVSERLESLLELNCSDDIEIATRFDDFDYYCSIMSLPFLLDHDFNKDTVGGVISNVMSIRDHYLSAKALDLSSYKTFNIGIAWAGNPQHPNDALRSCYLSSFKTIHDIPGVKLFSLQKDLRKRKYPGNKLIDFSEGCSDMKIVDMSPSMKNFEKTAEAITGLDLIITVDTAILHLAGALGKETWGLIPFNPDWRWGIEGEKTNWYPSITMFRQNQYGDWNTVFDKIKQRIEEKL